MKQKLPNIFAEALHGGRLFTITLFFVIYIAGLVIRHIFHRKRNDYQNPFQHLNDFEKGLHCVEYCETDAQMGLRLLLPW